MPLAALPTPGPRVTTTAPGLKLSSASVAAMMTAAVSCRARTKGMPCAAAASIRSRLEPPPGTPYSRGTPAARSAAATASAPVMLAVAASPRAPMPCCGMFMPSLPIPSSVQHRPAPAHAQPDPFMQLPREWATVTAY